MEIFRGKTYDAEAHRMYPIKGVNSYEGTSEFIKKMIRLIDGQGKDNKKDGKIQNEELQACYNKPELYHTFSRMVCKHKSEWSYKWEKIEADGKKFFKYHYPDASDDKIQQRLKELKAKYDALYDFWAVLKEKDILKTDTFWYFEPFAWVEQMKRVFEKAEIIFPLLVKPENDKDGKWGKNYYWAANQKSNQTTFNSNRGGGKRKHAGRDLYTQPLTPVVAMADGIVIGTGNFYAGTDYIAIYHKTPSGREFIINYGEVDPNKKMVKKGDTVEKGQQLGVTGYLKNITVIEGELIYMLHFEYYSGREGFNLDKNHILGHSNMYKRRSDLEDPLKILEEAYKNTFK